MFPTSSATRSERATARPGDDIIAHPDVVFDRAITLGASKQQLWPWIAQLGKRRAGWYLPRSVERVLPPQRRAARQIRQQWQGLQVGDVIPDYGGGRASFEVLQISAPDFVVYFSQRGRTRMTWSIALVTPSTGSASCTRVFLRLRLEPVRHVRVAMSLGGFFDAVTVAGLAAGLRERLADEATG
jgi:hypothetical protein